MKKWGILVGILLIGFLLFPNKEYFSMNDIEVLQDYSVHQQFEDTINVTITEKDIYQGTLLLVNKDYPIHENGILSDIVPLMEHPELVSGYRLLDLSILLSKDTTLRFAEMAGEALEDGLDDLLLTSGYRSLEEQEQLYQDMGADYALPAGYSEHHLGLALDIGSVESKMSEAPEGKWIADNSWKYGFILRYPEDKTDITGIQYEPWHIRYVGLPHSFIMQKKNFVLEEYLDYLKENPTIKVKVDSKEYLISYYEVDEETTIEIPVNKDYEISGNNMDGVIVTVEI